MKGKIEIQKFDAKTGKLVDTQVVNNLILTAMRDQLVRLLSGTFTNPVNSKYRWIKYVQFGLGVDPEEADQETLSAPLAKLFPVSYDFPREDTDTDYAVRFSVILNNTDANGVAIAEVGLVCDDKTLVARKVLPQVLSKTSEFFYQFNWTIEC